MEVTFERTGARRYGVRVTRAGFPTVEMDPAPGYDPRLPHDLIHFVVEEELGLSRGVFGQLAAGGHAGTFRLGPASSGSREGSRTRRHARRRGDRLAREGRDDAELSERAASICHYEWLARSSEPDRRRQARAMAPYVRRLRQDRSSGGELASLTEHAIGRVCRRLDELGARWSRLEVGESIVLSWSGRRRGAA